MVVGYGEGIWRRERKEGKEGRKRKEEKGGKGGGKKKGGKKGEEGAIATAMGPLPNRRGERQAREASAVVRPPCKSTVIA